MTASTWQRNWGRITHPVRTARFAVRRAKYAITQVQQVLERERFDPRYLFIPGTRAEDERRAANAVDVRDCPELEMHAASLDPAKASDHLKKFGVLLVRGDDAMRATIAEYSADLDKLGFWDKPVPRGGGLWEFQPESPFRFRLHEVLRQRFYPMLSAYLGSELLLSASGTIGTLRTVSAQQPDALIPFHQDISPVGARNGLTAWFAMDPEGIGDIAPGLRFIASLRGRYYRLLDHHINTETHGFSIPALKLKPHEFFWTPVMRPGDLVFFDPYSPHSSCSTPEMTQPRTSVDVRIMPFSVAKCRDFQETPGFGAILFDDKSMIAPSSVLTGHMFEYDVSGASAAVAEAWAQED